MSGRLAAIWPVFCSMLKKVSWQAVHDRNQIHSHRPDLYGDKPPFQLLTHSGLYILCLGAYSFHP